MAAKPEKRVDHVVAWYSRNEWVNVYKDLFSESQELQKHALRRISVWRSHSGNKIAAAVESSAVLIHATIVDQESSKHEVELEMEIRMAYSLAIIRFINLITENMQTKQFAVSVHVLANRIGLPHWLVDLRHGSTHRELPSLNILRHGAQFSLSWLKIKYWDAMFETGSVDPILESQSKNEFEIYNNRQILEDGLVSFMQDQFHALESSQLHKDNSNNCDELRAIFLNDLDCAIDCVLTEGFLLATNEQLDAIGIIRSDIDIENLPLNIILFWKPALSVFHDLGMTQQIVLSFVSMFTSHPENDNILVIGWLITIIDSVIAVLEDHTKQPCHLYSTSCDLPWHQLLDMCIKNPGNYTRSILNRVLRYQTPQLTEIQKIAILKLNDIYLCSDISKDVKPSSNKLYDIQDLKKHVGISHDPLVHHKFSFKNSIWKLSSATCDWSNFNIGECPNFEVNYSNMEFPLLLNEEFNSNVTDSSSSDSEPETFVNNAYWSEQELKDITSNIELW